MVNFGAILTLTKVESCIKKAASKVNQLQPSHHTVIKHMHTLMTVGLFILRCSEQGLGKNTYQCNTYSLSFQGTLAGKRTLE